MTSQAIDAFRRAAADAGDPATAGPVRKVLHLINGEFYAGAERVQDLLAARLPEFGYRASFVCLKSGEFQRQLERGASESELVPMRSRFDAVAVGRRVAEHALATGCRLIHTHTPRAALVGGVASALAELPLVHHVHSPTARNTDRPWLDTFNAWVERAALLRASALIPVSRSLARDLSRYGYPRERITPVANGVAISQRRVVPGTGRGLTLGVVALFRPRKGIETLLQALAATNRWKYPVRIRAVGGFESAEYQRSVRALCDQLGLSGQVEWRGFQQDVTGELARMDALVLPSLFGEGMPMVVLEAMAVGLPIVASRVEGVPEVVRDGAEGVLVEPGDVDGLARAIAWLARDRGTLRQMGAAGRRRQQQTYSDVAMAEQVSRIYDRVLGRPLVRRDGTLLRAVRGVS